MENVLTKLGSHRLSSFRNTLLQAEKYSSSAPVAAQRWTSTFRARRAQDFRAGLGASATRKTCLQINQKHDARNHSTASAASSINPSSSVSQTEVSHFSRLASSWWDPHGPSRLLHLMNPLRHDFIQSCLASSLPVAGEEGAFAPGKKYQYLDIGCGGGIFASSAARLPSTESVTAIDPTPEVIAVAKSHARRDPVLSHGSRLQYLNCAIEDLPLPSSRRSSPSTRGSDDASTPRDGELGQEEQKNGRYDIVTLFEVLEHITHPSSFLSTTISHLRPGGWLIGSTISRSTLSYLTTILIAEAPFVGVVPRGTHDWDKYINPAELSGFFGSEDARRDGVEWGEFVTRGVVYLPAMGWRVVQGSEEFGNYFFGIQRLR